MRILVRENTLLNASSRFATSAQQLEDDCRDLRQSFENLDAQSEAIAALRLQVYEVLAKGERIAGGLQEFSAFLEKVTYEMSDADRFGADSVTRAANEFADLVQRLSNVAVVPTPSFYSTVAGPGQISLESTGSLAWLNNVIRS